MKEMYRGAAHIAIYTEDIDASIAFYEKIGGTLLEEKNTLHTEDGEKYLALLEFGGFTLEFMQCPTPAPMTEGNIPHFAVYVDDVDEAAAKLRAVGVDTFQSDEKKVLPTLFGGLENWFFTGPSGEQVELMKML